MTTCCGSRAANAADRRFVTLVVRRIGAWPPAGRMDRDRAARLRKPDSGHIDTISMNAGRVWLLWSERRPADRAATGPMPHGCGSFGVTVSGGECEAVLVTAEVVAVVFAGDVPGPVGVVVAVGGDGAEPEHGLGAGQAPAGAGDAHPVGDEVAAGAFDDAGGDRPAGGEGGGVVQVGLLGGQVAHGGADDPG